MKNKIFVLLLAGGALLSSCSGNSGQNDGNQSSEDPSSIVADTRVKEIYALYQANGGTLTYEEWLASIKGEDGLSLLTGHGSPSADLGKTGDSYIDLDTWDFFVKATDGWANQGNLKKEAVETYSVKWVDYDGEVLELDEKVEKGTTPSYGGVTPTRERDGKYVYTFKGWSPEVKAVDSDQVYVAQYDSDAKTYKITWKDYNGAVLKTDNDVAYGTVPTYDALYPTREAEEGYTYEFAGWTPAVAKATADQVYVATYRKTAKTYLVQFVDDDGSLLQSSMMEYGSTPTFDAYRNPSKEQTAQYTYTFKGWDKEITAVTGAATYKAVYDKKIRQYTVTWYASGYGEIKSEKLDYGAVPTAPSNDEIPEKSPATKYTYEFTGWDKTVSEVTGDVTYNAVYEQRTRYYAVSWLDADGNAISSSNEEYASSIEELAPAVPEGKVFKGWALSKGSSSCVTFPYSVREDTTFYAYFVNEFEYNYLPLTDSYSLYKFSGTSAITTIPSSYDDGEHGSKPITEIAASAFLGSPITSMILPDTIATIFGKAFANCLSLTALFIPDSVTTISEGAILGDAEMNIYCEASSKPSGWDDYWNVTSYWVTTGKTPSRDSFNEKIAWGYVK